MRKQHALTRAPQWSPFLLRIALGTVFIVHGAQKLFGMFGGPGLDGFGGFLGSLGVPMASAIAILVGLIEFGGGVFVLLGLGTRIFAGLITMVMFNAIIFVHAKNGFLASNGGIEFVLTLALASLTLLLIGPGTFSIDRLFTRSRMRERPREREIIVLEEEDLRDTNASIPLKKDDSQKKKPFSSKKTSKPVKKKAN